MPLFEYECQECGKKFETLVQQHPQSEYVEKAKLYAQQARQRMAGSAPATKEGEE